ncbi:helix-turn-helix domain-containing protein [Streptomyces rubiginosohelvolus]
MPSIALGTAADMAYWTGRPIGTIWRWASEGRLTTYGSGKQTRYNLMEVEPAERDSDTFEIKSTAPPPPIKEAAHAA